MIAAVWHIRARCQCRAADRPQIKVELEARLDAERVRDAPCRFDLAHVPLPVVNGEGAQREAVSLCDRRGRVRIEAAAQEDNRAHSDAAGRGWPDVFVELHLEARP